MYRAQGFAHATAVHHLHRLRSSQDGQGTVEYVGLILLLAGVMVAVVKQGKDGSIADSIVGKLKDSIADVGSARKG